VRLLLTGSSGWLGRHLAPLAVDRGHEVVGFDVAPGPHTQIIGSVADEGCVRHVFAECAIDAVIHGGALHKPDIVRYSKSTFVDVNVRGTLNLLEAAVRAGHDRFVFTSTTSLMISQAIREERQEEAVWLDEATAPLEPRNVYGATKLAAEQLCRVQHLEHGIACIILRTARFFPEEDDMAHAQATAGANTKANELLHRRLAVRDAAEAHVVALERAPALRFETFVLSAPTPFRREDARDLKRDAASVVTRYHPEATELYRRAGWSLPTSIGRVYDATHAERRLGFRCSTAFGSVLTALRDGQPMPFAHDPTYLSPKEVAESTTSREGDG